MSEPGSRCGRKRSWTCLVMPLAWCLHGDASLAWWRLWVMHTCVDHDTCSAMSVEWLLLRQTSVVFRLIHLSYTTWWLFVQNVDISFSFTSCLLRCFVEVVEWSYSIVHHASASTRSSAQWLPLTHNNAFSWRHGMLSDCCWQTTMEVSWRCEVLSDCCWQTTMQVSWRHEVFSDCCWQTTMQVSWRHEVLSDCCWQTTMQVLCHREVLVTAADRQCKFRVTHFRRWLHAAQQSKVPARLSTLDSIHNIQQNFLWTCVLWFD